MRWISILKKYRGHETGRAGLFRKTCRTWIYRIFRENFEKRKIFFEKYHNNQLNEEEFRQLLSDASSLIPEKERNEFLERFIKNELTDEDFNNVLKHAVPDMFYLRDMIIGVGGNPDLKLDYDRTMSLLSIERKITKDALEHFWNSEEYQDYKNNGHSEKEIWQRFMDAARSYGAYPLYCDPYDGRYKLLDLNGYIYILRKRTRSIGQEALNKAEDFKAISTMFPSVKKLLPPVDGEIERLRPFDTLKLNPPRYTCPLCDKVFKDEKFLKRHLVYKHKAQ